MKSPCTSHCHYASQFDIPACIKLNNVPWCDYRTSFIPLTIKTFLLVSKAITVDEGELPKAGCLAALSSVITVLFKGEMVYIEMEMPLFSVSNWNFCFELRTILKAITKENLKYGNSLFSTV